MASRPTPTTPTVTRSMTFPTMALPRGAMERRQASSTRRSLPTRTPTTATTMRTYASPLPRAMFGNRPGARDCRGRSACWRKAGPFPRLSSSAPAFLLPRPIVPPPRPWPRRITAQRCSPTALGLGSQAAATLTNSASTQPSSRLPPPASGISAAISFAGRDFSIPMCRCSSAPRSMSLRKIRSLLWARTSSTCSITRTSTSPSPTSRIRSSARSPGPFPRLPVFWVPGSAATPHRGRSSSPPGSRFRFFSVCPG